MAKGKSLNIHKVKHPSVLKGRYPSVTDLGVKSRKALPGVKGITHKLPDVEDLAPKKTAKKLPRLMDIT